MCNSPSLKAVDSLAAPVFLLPKEHSTSPRITYQTLHGCSSSNRRSPQPPLRLASDLSVISTSTEDLTATARIRNTFLDIENHNDDEDDPSDSSDRFCTITRQVMSASAIDYHPSSKPNNQLLAAVLKPHVMEDLTNIKISISASPSLTPLPANPCLSPISSAISEPDSESQQQSPQANRIVVTPALRQMIPLDANGTETSIGSINHAQGECKPCVFHNHPKKPEGCLNGIECAFCHFEHARVKARASKKSRARRASQAANGPNSPLVLPLPHHKF